MPSFTQRLRYLFSNKTETLLKSRAQKISLIPPRDPALVRLLASRSQQDADIEGDKALSVAAYYCGVNLISSVLGMLPVSFHDKLKDGSLKISTTNPLNSLLDYQPNGFQTPSMFKATLENWAINWGNGVAEIVRKGDNITALVPHHPSVVEIKDGTNGDVEYWIKRDKDKEPDKLNASEVIHIPNLSSDGVRGMPLWQQASRTLGLTVSSEVYGTSFFRNGSTMSGIVKHPEDLGADAASALQERIEKAHAGAFNAFKVLVLDEGMTWDSTSIPNEAAQFLETRQFQVIDVARWLNIPPVLLFDLTAGTFSNVEQLTLQFMVYTMGPWINRWEEELNLKLGGGPNVKAKFDRSNMQVIDMATRFEAWSKGRNAGFMSLNDILKRENMPLLPDEIGNSHLAPSTMKTLERTDFGNAVDMASVSVLMEFFKGVGSPMLPSTAVEIINGALPSASEPFVSSLLSILRIKGLITTVPNGQTAN